MRLELEARRLEVVLIPSPVEFWPTDRQRRVVCERNPGWYRQLCRQHPSRRSRPRRRQKPDTCIKRRHVLRALGEIEDGRLDTEYARLDTEYARRVYPFVEKAAEQYVATFTRKRGQPGQQEQAYAD
jgi:hypothetical protein